MQRAVESEQMAAEAQVHDEEHQQRYSPSSANAPDTPQTVTQVFGVTSCKARAAAVRQSMGGSGRGPLACAALRSLRHQTHLCQPAHPPHEPVRGADPLADKWWLCALIHPAWRCVRAAGQPGAAAGAGQQAH